MRHVSKGQLRPGFLPWDLHGLQQPGTTIRATGTSVTVTATYAQTWRSIAQLINGARRGETTTITLKNDIKATNLDTALSIAKDKNIVIKLNGHTINRNDSTSSSVGSKSNKGSAIINAGNLTINGPGTITGGSAVEGGGINVSSGSVTLKDVTIRDNYASRAGGGVYVARASARLPLTALRASRTTTAVTAATIVLTITCTWAQMLLTGLRL